jgi:hypothetical protein
MIPCAGKVRQVARGLGRGMLLRAGPSLTASAPPRRPAAGSGVAVRLGFCRLLEHAARFRYRSLATRRGSGCVPAPGPPASPACRMPSKASRAKCPGPDAVRLRPCRVAPHPPARFASGARCVPAGGPNRCAARGVPAVPSRPGRPAIHADCLGPCRVLEHAAPLRPRAHAWHWAPGVFVCRARLTRLRGACLPQPSGRGGLRPRRPQRPITLRRLHRAMLARAGQPSAGASVRGARAAGA